jgi:protein-S-isoprenylcysteine O-methyltransferase Ste14
MRAFWLAVRSITWVVLLPGVVAGYIPWAFFGLGDIYWSPEAPGLYLGVVLVASGIALLAMCIWEFARRGRGTLSPVDPPKELVVQGLYRYVRNPMYLAVSLILIGEHMLTHSWPLLVYWAVCFVIWNVFVIGYEEPTLRRQFGESYERYARDVRRWIPRFRI